MRPVSRLITPMLALSLMACAEEGPTAYVTFNIPRDEDCIVSPGSTLFLPSGVYDVAPGGGGNSKACAQSYRLNLLVNSSLRASARPATGLAEPNVLQIQSAEVYLMDINKAPIRFLDPVLPNPFQVNTANSLPPSTTGSPSTAIAQVEAIPVAYASSLASMFKDEQILAEVQIFGTTLGEVDVDFKPFVYAIRICDRCLTVCRGDLSQEEADELQSGQCRDNAGADGRFCIDPNC